MSVYFVNACDSRRYRVCNNAIICFVFVERLRSFWTFTISDGSRDKRRRCENPHTKHHSLQLKNCWQEILTTEFIQRMKLLRHLSLLVCGFFVSIAVRNEIFGLRTIWNMEYSWKCMLTWTFGSFLSVEVKLFATN